MSHLIAIVGASARAAACSALRAGLAPTTADLFADADLRRRAPATRIADYPAAFPDWLRAIQPAAWMYTGALENHPELVDAMADIAPLWGNGGDVLRRVRSPWLLAEALRDDDLLFPETRASADGLPRDGSWLAKTCRGAGGSGVSTLDAHAPPVAGPARGPGATDSGRLAIAPHGRGHVVYQQRIAGTEYSAVCVAAAGAATLLGVVRPLVGAAWLGAHEFQYCGSIGPAPVDDAVRNEICRIGDRLAERFRLVGLFGIDLMVSDDGVWTIEVNPRYTASVEIVERAIGVRAVAAHAATWAGAESNGQPHSASCIHGKAILFAKRDVTVADRFASWAHAEAMCEPWPALADVPCAGTAITAGRPILTLFAHAPTPQEVERQLQRRAAKIEDQLYATAGAQP